MQSRLPPSCDREVFNGPALAHLLCDLMVSDEYVVQLSSKPSVLECVGFALATCPCVQRDQLTSYHDISEGLKIRGRLPLISRVNSATAYQVGHGRNLNVKIPRTHTQIPPWHLLNARIQHLQNPSALALQFRSICTLVPGMLVHIYNVKMVQASSTRDARMQNAT